MKKILILIISLTSLLVLAGIGFILASSPIMRSLPQPSGSYTVGKQSLVVTVAAAEKYRDFPVQLYYPSSLPKEKARRFPYEEHKLNAYKAKLSQDHAVPVLVWNYLFTGITSYAEPNATIVQKKSALPVLIFLPGIGTLPLYGSLLEELASHGYCVAEIEPPYDVELAVFPGDKVIELDPVLKKAMASTDRSTIYAYRAEAHKRWMRYIEVLIDKLKTVNDDEASPFYHKLDLRRVSIIGHSHGGGVATDFCAHHDICKTGINMDGWTKSAQKIEPFKKPFLFLMSEKGIDEVSELAALMPNYATKIELKGAEHTSFSDLAFLKQPAAWFLEITPSTNAQVRAFHAIILAFLRHYQNI